jgi:two-component system, NarL family, response regulator DevR
MLKRMATIRLFLVDDHDLIRRGLAAFIDAQEDMEVAGEASTAEAALARIPAVRPDIVVLDVRLPDGNGVEVCRELRSRVDGLRVVMLTSFTDESALVDSIVAGAEGYLLKTTAGDDLILALRRVAAGQSLVDPSLTASIFERLRNGRVEEPEGRLTAQEQRVLDLIAEGLTNREIAERMHLAERTIKNYVSNMLGKLGMRHRTEAALFVSRRRKAG